jgi:cytidylate kinase
MHKIIVAIDGYSACGKSTTAKAVAARLGYSYIDTGAMYRAVTLYFCEHYVSLTNDREVEAALRSIKIHFSYNPALGKSETYLNGLNVEREIRKMYISGKVSEVSALPQVRREMVQQQQRMGQKKGIVMDGRDIGTFVFPQAELKIFMTADLMVRARRRQLELSEREEYVELDEILDNLKTRDRIDTTRAENPLTQAPDAYVLDTTHITTDEQVDFVANLAQRRMMDNDPMNGNAPANVK